MSIIKVFFVGKEISGASRKKLKKVDRPEVKSYIRRGKRGSFPFGKVTGIKTN